MCGIGGLVWRKKENAFPFVSILERSLSHRGPDSKGYLLFQNNKVELFEDISKKVAHDIPQVFLIHRRLSIIDLSKAGHQPMGYRNGDLWIVFNGEIYNYVELREELENKGYEFRSNTDTEVILAAYDKWGKDCINRFNGMWSFVILDIRKNILFGSRDRFGVKPLYFSIAKEFFAFSSEIKALIKLPFIEKKINPEAVFYYLMFDLEEGKEEGFIKGIYELMPSYCFEYHINSHRLKKWKYFDLEYKEEYEPFKKRKFYCYVQNIREKIFEAVRIRLRSDVPIGSCLSGGIDSSSIVCVIDRLLKEELYPQAAEKKLFTASFNFKEIDESKWAQIVANYTRGRWYQILPNEKSLISDLEDLIYTQDIPFGSLSIYAQYSVMKKVKESGVKVIMDGQGGDELFTGYISYYWSYIKELLSNNPFLAIKELFLLKNSPLKWKEFIYAAKGILKKGSPYGQKQALLSRYISKELQNECKNQFYHDNITGQKSSSLNQVLYKFMTGPRLKSLLRYEDRNSMNFSIEARTPFADDINLISMVFKIPSSYKIRNGQSKILLRNAMAGIVPAPILMRKEKIGFTAPEYIWLKRLKNVFIDYITSDLNCFFDVNKIIKEWDRFLYLQPSIGITGLWRFVNLGMWKYVFSLSI